MPIFFHKKGALAFFGQRALGNSHSFLVLPLCGESYHHYLIFGGLAFLKKKARSPMLKGFGVDFPAVLKFTGQQYCEKKSTNAQQ